jgi:peroxiredoxin
MEDNPFSILAINVEETRRKVKWLVDYLNPHITILFDRDRAVFNAWEGIVLPTSFLLDRQGHVRYVVKGPYDWDAEQAIDIIEKLLGESTTGMVNHTDPAID